MEQMKLKVLDKTQVSRDIFICGDWGSEKVEESSQVNIPGNWQCQLSGLILF